MKNKLDKPVKVWIIVASIVLSFFLIASIVLVNVPFLYGTINTVFGGERRVLVSGNADDYQRFTADYETKAEALKAANDLNETICEEGFVLLKNENSLPLANGSKVTVFGRNSVDLVLGGAGSNAGSSHGADEKTVYSSLSEAGFSYNDVMKSFYENDSTKRPQAPSMGSIITGFPIAETPVSSYTSSVRASYANYNDAAIVVLSRIGGEGFDLPRTMKWDGSKYTNWSGSETIPGARSKDDHYLQLDKNETDMLKEACDNFDNVIVVINSASTLELGFLDDPSHYAYNSKIKGAIWVGSPGNTGINALGRILSGKVDPSGRTVDTYARDFRNDPTWNNFGNNMTENGNKYTNGGSRGAYFVDYEEGIYTGYRYYETRGFVESENGNDGWYSENVVYPFGYGLSYTTFEWEITPSLADGANIARETKLAFSVKVTNTGDRAGKDVVELYYTAPYTSGGIEKAHVVLGGFVKTDLLSAGESKTYVVELPVENMASYDYADKNANGFKGWELEKGLYTVSVSKNAHEHVASFGYNLPSDVTLPTDAATGTTVRNLFDDVSSHIGTYLSRSDFQGTWTTRPTSADLLVSDEFLNGFNYKLNDKPSDPWYTDVMPKQASTQLSDDEVTVKLYELFGKDFDDELWNTLLDQLSVDQMINLVKSGNYKTAQIENIGKPLTTDADGPMGFAVFMGTPTVYDTCYYASEVVVASTWNKDLANKMGLAVGNEGVIGDERGDKVPYSGWYAPAMNIHRSQFGGRNFEYYSEDGYLSGVMAAEVVKGANSKGVYTFCKHLVLNEQETNRDTSGLATWTNEQAMREIYFRPFEMVVKEGKTTAIMSSFNRIGSNWTGGSYNLLTALLRDEWGFKGSVITDYNLSSYMNVDKMIRAGGDLSLSPSKNITKSSDATFVSSLRRATKNILYTVVNSNAMNGIGDGVVYKYEKPIWEIVMIVVDVALFVAMGVWGTLVILAARRKRIFAQKNVQATKSAVPTGNDNVALADAVETGPSSATEPKSEQKVGHGSFGNNFVGLEPVKSLREQFAELWPEQRRFFDEIRVHASSKPKVTVTEAKKYLTVSLGRDKLVRLRIRRNFVEAVFFMSDNTFRNAVAEAQVNTKEAVSVMRVASDKDLENAKKTIDYKYDAIVADRKARKKAKQKDPETK